MKQQKNSEINFRLKALKNLLKAEKIDYFILPNSDEFFSEYLPESEKRIQYLTGFSGSNAVIIVGVEKSYFFTDGRYILQAENELDLSEFEIFNIAQKTVLVWLEENLSAGKKVALDGKLMTVNFVKACEKIAKEREVELLFLNTNPVDKIWLDRPTASNSEVFFCNKKMTGADSLEKRKLILENLEADAVIITKPENICWLLNIRAADVEFTPLLLAYAILFKSGEVDLFVDEKRILNRENFELTNVNFIQADCFDLRISVLKKSFNKIQIDAASTNYWLYDILQKHNFEIVNKIDAIEIAKSCKNDAEIFGAIKSHEIDGLAVTRFLFWLQKSLEKNAEIDEISASERLLEFRKCSVDFLYPSFASISGFASNGAVIHYRATQKTNKKIGVKNPNRRSSRVETSGRLLPQSFQIPRQEASAGFDSAQPAVGEGEGTLYLIDSGGQYFGENFCGTTDITRTIAIGKPSAEMIENFTRVLKGHIALARIKFPRGTSGAQLDVLAREHLWNAKKDYDHGTGHGVGSFLSVHEGPCGISKRSNQPLLEGMILSNEPGFYKNGEYGIRIENLMLVEKSKDENLGENSEKNNREFLQFITLTLAPIDPKLIDFKMMTYPEKKWLKEYHERILMTLKSGLNFDEIKWLENLVQDFS